MTTSQSLFADEPKPSGPVECLGQTFSSDEARCEHYLAILREKLKDPAFRKLDGFPIGTDEDILALSDPPYYTACPNPFIEDFIKHYGKPYHPSVPYNKEPFAADVSEGKNDPIYNAHSYHTKVPHKAIMRYILHYTQPGDVVFDGFCGTGMTGVAAQLCGDRSVVGSLGYRVEADGTILEQGQENGRSVWKTFSRLGERRAILNDLSPAATFVAYNYNTPVDVPTFQAHAKRLIAQVNEKCGWMYTTLHFPSQSQMDAAISLIDINEKPNLGQCGVAGVVNFTLWSDVFTCPECAGELTFWDVAVDHDNPGLKSSFNCGHCGTELKKGQLERIWDSHIDRATGLAVKQARQIPVLINYSIGSKRYEKKPDSVDIALLKKMDAQNITTWYPTTAIPDGFNTRQPKESHGITHEHHFYTSSNLFALAEIWSRAKHLPGRFSKAMMLAHSAANPTTSKMRRYRTDKKGGGPLSGTLYVASLITPPNVMLSVGRNIDFVSGAFTELTSVSGCVLTTTQSSTELSMSTNSVDYLFIDPPFGANINYSELNFFWEAWLRIFTNNKSEAIENDIQGKTLNDYRVLMKLCFNEAFRVLKPGRWMTVEFSNTRATVWNAIQTALQEAGFVVANVSALDKKQGSFKAVTTTTAVKQDLIISAYKPNGGLEERFAKAGGSEDSAWDFVRTHLKYLPTVKIKGGQIEFVAERDPRIIFDRLVAWFVRHNFSVPLSSQEFQAGLAQRFAERDGMVFLPEQVSEYDKKRMQTAQAPQMEMFIADERSAIDWLSDFLKKKPSTYQEIHPEFIKQLGAGWKKHEAKPELSYLLESNFLCYDPKDKDGVEVPSQIHSYLSTNWQEFRNLEKSDPRLRAKATDRWYVADPNKARDLEMVRDKALLKEFDSYRSFTGRRLKTFRLEAMRTGFKTAWANRDYATIIAVAQKVPEEALQEDEKLLLWYDQALTRTEVGA